MEKFVIEGGHPLNGEITPTGNKNAALPLLAACLLTDETITYHNLPQINDVRTMLAIMQSIGVTVDTSRWDEDRLVRLTAQKVESSELDYELCRRIRASLLLMGP
ncbi:MAG: UDP-N-acetylglucosamine 1-carboxyvinyltransferase, partial [Candidatus Chloroheliales bacterium]